MVILLLTVVILFVAIEIRRAKLAAFVTTADLCKTYAFQPVDSYPGRYACRGRSFVLGGGNLAFKKQLIDSLGLLDLPAGTEIDLSYRNQIVIKGMDNDSTR